MKYPREGSSDISVVICGEAGQGIKTVEEILVKAVKRSGYNVFSIKEYMSRIRGGSNSTSIRIGKKRIRAPVKRMDIVFPMSKDALGHLEWRMDEVTTVILDPDLSGDPGKDPGFRPIIIKIKEKAKEIGGAIYINIITAGLISGLVGVKKREFREILEKKFSKKGGKSLDKNMKAMNAGYEMAAQLIESGELEIEMDQVDQVKEEIMMKGVNSISLGAVAGGVDMITSYPMSPSTGVLVDLAGRQERYGIIAEQAEDEIAAINMALGGWYAGARAMVTTSGGGFALMSEGMSLAGMMELPLVAHIAQRPGPATGLPTRTEQGDLNLAVFSGHGDFPRLVLAPADIEQGFELTRKAFEMADRFQVPVIVLTDQYFVDSYYNVPDLEMEKGTPKRSIKRTGKDYERYIITDDGISPRGIPGHGEGIVKMDSDEHDESGHITESMETRVKMVEKRKRKMSSLIESSVPPTIIGDGKGIFVLCWGSTLHTVKEALEGMDDVSIVHLPQVFPLPPSLKDKLEGAESIISVENNVTGQLSSLVGMELGIIIKERILKFDGLPFTVEELKDKLGTVIANDGGDA